MTSDVNGGRGCMSRDELTTLLAEQTRRADDHERMVAHLREDLETAREALEAIRGTDGRSEPEYVRQAQLEITVARRRARDAEHRAAAADRVAAEAKRRMAESRAYVAQAAKDWRGGGELGATLSAALLSLGGA
jgi:hypothetical protein